MGSFFRLHMLAVLGADVCLGLWSLFMIYRELGTYERTLTSFEPSQVLGSTGILLACGALMRLYDYSRRIFLLTLSLSHASHGAMVMLFTALPLFMGFVFSFYMLFRDTVLHVDHLRIPAVHSR